MQFDGVPPMRLIERLQIETEAFHADADEDALQLLGAATPADYLRFLTRTLGFVQPLERAIVRTPGIEQVVDLRRFEKHHLLRRDLIGFRMHPDDIDRLPQCTLPVFDSPEEALGWAFVGERSTLAHGNLFRHLASIMPGDVAFTSTYLKCYFGAVGESWKAFADALERTAPTADRAERVIDSARAAFRLHRAWRRHHDDEAPSPPSEATVRDEQRGA